MNPERHSLRKILVVDCQLAGIAGDMLVGALLDLGVDITDFLKGMNTASKYLAGYDDFKVTVETVDRHGFQAKKLNVYPPDHIGEETHSHVHEHSQGNGQHSHSHEHDHEQTYEHDTETKHANSHIHGSTIKNAITQMTKDLGLSENATKLGVSAIDSLIAAEAKMHGGTPEHVHLHEAGSIDTVVDIVGAVYAMDKLELFKNTKIYSTPVAVGGGLFEFSHGKVSSPAPATLEILSSHNFPIRGGPIKFELTTPTGAALLVNMVNEVSEFYPEVKPLNVGYGAGSKDFEVMSNVVRLTLGEPMPRFFLDDEIVVLETNVDDVSGEVIGHTIDKIMADGAKDVSVIPTTTKKNRPGYIIKVITDREHSSKLTQRLMEETGTLGVRVSSSQRHLLPRETKIMKIHIEGVEADIHYKISRSIDGEMIQIKPEYGDLVMLSEKTGRPLRLLDDLVKRKIESG